MNKTITLHTYQGEIIAYFRISNNGQIITGEYYPKRNMLLMSKKTDRNIRASLMTRVKDYIRNPANHYKIMGIFENPWLLEI